MSLPCYYMGARAGSLKGCSGAPAVHKCLSSDVPSGLCVTRTGNVMRDGKLGDKALTIFPFRKADLDNGKEPWTDWVLSCHCCPFRKNPPQSVIEVYTRRDNLSKQISDYEAANTLEERDEAAIRIASP